MDLEYKITTTAELAGAEAAADAIERNIGKAKALKQDYSALDAQLKTMRGSIDEAKAATQAQTDADDELKRANEQLADSVHTVSAREAELAEHSEKSATDMRGTLRIAGELNRVLPGMGNLMMIAFNPVVATLVFVGSLLAAIVKDISDTNAELQKMADADFDVSGITDGTAAIEAQLETLGSSVGKVDEFATATDHVADAQKRVADETNHAIDALKTQAQYDEEEAKAREKIALDKIKLNVATGKMTPAQGAVAEVDITARTAREADARKSALEKDEILAREKERADLTAQQQELTGDKISGAGKPETAQANADDAKNLAVKYKQAADSQEKYLEDFSKSMTGDEHAKQQAKLAQLIQIQVQQEGLADDLAVTAQTAKEEWTKLTTSLKKVNDRLAELGDQIPQLVSKHAAADDHRGTMSTLASQTAATQRATADVDHGNKDLATITEIGSKGTQTSADAVKVAAALKDAHSAVADAMTVVSQLAGMGADVTDLKKKVAQLKYALDHK